MMEFDHAFPVDDFKHEESFDCGCGPTLEQMQALGLPPMCVHKPVHVASIPIPDAPPEDWT